ncbi:MAG: transcriptional regulator protein, partial [Gemmatimonadetes bacterium]|nr:transcriptional regulator protein [Gemmatimonadota bacterium]
ISAVCEESRLAVLIDDLHWADDDSARLIASVGERHSDRRLLLVLATRPREFEAARVRGTTTRIQVNALQVDEVEVLLASIARLPDGEERALVAAVHLSSAGNPLLILETLRLAMDTAALAIVEGAWRVIDDRTISDWLNQQSVIANRLARLDAHALLVARVLAAAGRPLPVRSLATTPDALPELAGVLQWLETRDVTAHVPEGWTISHDVVADALLGSVPPAELRRVRLAAAAALTRSDDLTSLKSALHLLAAIRAWEECADLVRSLARRSSTTASEARSATRSAVLSVHDPDARREIMARLPLATRYPFGRIAFACVALIAAFIGFAALRMWRQAVPDSSDSEIVFFATTGNGVNHAVPVRLTVDRWSPSDPIDASDIRTQLPWPAEGMRNGGLGPLDGATALIRDFPDSGGVDVVLWYPEGHEERLTATKGDDVPDGWSPDGRAILIESSRDGEIGHRALYVVDVATRRSRRLTTGGTRQATDGSAMWSPDGSRIAFSRNYYDVRPGEFCTVDADGRNESCHALEGGSAANISGWLDAARVAVFIDSANVLRTDVINVQTGETSRLSQRYQNCWVSPNGAWLACRSSNESPAITVSPIAAPQAARTVILPQDTRFAQVFWRAPAKLRQTIARISIRSPVTSVPVGVGTLLHAVAYGTDDQRLQLVAPRWSVDDTTRATISREGVLQVARPGPVVVRVTAGGWRSAELLLTAIGMTATTVLEENWSSGFERRWRFYGEPLPEVVSDGTHRAFWNRGDGNYFSGAHTVGGVPAGDGVWLEAHVNSRLTATQWQTIQIFLNGTSRTLAGWDHRNGNIPPMPSVCGFGYPAGEGFSALRRMAPGNDVSASLGYPTDSLGRGGWYR